MNTFLKTKGAQASTGKMYISGWLLAEHLKYVYAMLSSCFFIPLLNFFIVKQRKKSIFILCLGVVKVMAWHSSYTGHMFGWSNHPICIYYLYSLVWSFLNSYTVVTILLCTSTGRQTSALLEQKYCINPWGITVQCNFYPLPLDMQSQAMPGQCTYK